MSVRLVESRNGCLRPLSGDHPMNIHADTPVIPVPGCPAIRARFAMITLAYAAMADRVDPEEMDRTGALVFRTFGADHEMTREIERFIDTVTDGDGSPDLWREAGERLKRAVQATDRSGVRVVARAEGVA